MEPITMTLAQWISGLRRDDVPADVRATLRLLALDTFACALAGRSQPWTRAVRAWALAPGSIPQAPSRIWGEPCGRLRAADAALVNGAAAHAFELDDFHNAKVHLGAVVVPAVFALAESLNAAPERIEAALAAGYEVVIRSSLALRPGLARLQGWHLTAVCGPLGAAAAASVLLGLDAQRTAWALGLAGTQSGGLFAFTADGASSKRFHPGRAAQAGVMAAELASLGLSGPTQLFEARDGGWLRAFSQDPDPAALIDGLGKHWHGAETNFKPYACCGSVHAHVDAALALRSRWAPGRGVRVGMPKVVLVQCGYEYRPGTALNAQMSGRYSVAAALLDGAVLRIRAKNPLIADQIANNYRKADITPRQRAMLDFALKVCLDAQSTSAQDLEVLRGHGFSDDDIWDIAAISAFFALSNRMASVTEMRPNDEFYMMGRVPKS